MQSKLQTTATFVVGVAIGAAMVYLAPPPDPTAPRTPAGGEPGPAPGDGVVLDASGAPLPSPDAAEGPPIPPGGEAGDGDGAAREDLADASRRDEGRPLDWVEQHLMSAASFWEGQAGAWEALADPDLKPLAVSARELAASVPAMGELAPPLPEVVIWVSEELRLYDQAKARGLDVSAIELELGEFLQGRN